MMSPVWESDRVTNSTGDEAARDFFVSYTQVDWAWAEWIAWLLEENGYRVLVQGWDMVAGSNWVSRMDQGVQRTTRTVAVLSPDYQSSVYGTAEWQAAWADDPLGLQRKLITVRVRGDWPSGLLAGVISIDLVGLPEAGARRRLLNDIAAAVQGRAKPDSPPVFPPTLRAVPAEPRFPGALGLGPLVGNTADGGGRDLVFVSYSHADTPWVQRLKVLLKPLVDRKRLRLWADTDIRVGDE